MLVDELFFSNFLLLLVCVYVHAYACIYVHNVFMEHACHSL